MQFCLSEVFFGQPDYPVQVKIRFFSFQKSRFYVPEPSFVTFKPGFSGLIILIFSGTYYIEANGDRDISTEIKLIYVKKPDKVSLEVNERDYNGDRNEVEISEGDQIVTCR